MPHSGNADWHRMHDTVVQIWESTEESFAGAAAMVSVPILHDASIGIVHRTYFVGGALAAGDPGGQQRWCLPDAVDRMYAAYCGTLTAEIDHLASQ